MVDWNNDGKKDLLLGEWGGMNGVNLLSIEELHAQQGNTASSQRLYRVKLQMTDGRLLHLDMERSFASRNLP